MAHLSAFIVLAVLCPWLVWSRWPQVKQDATRALGLGVGLGAAAAYYASFTGLVIRQLGRLGEGGGSAGQGVFAAVAGQGAAVVGQWGLPLMVLLLLGLPSPSSGQHDRDFAAWWRAGLVLLLMALVTPLDVRWVYALGVAAAVAGAEGFVRLWRGSRLAAAALLGAEAFLAATTAWVALWDRYR
jgi:hypothetical protein